MQFVFVVALLATLIALAVAVANYRARRSWLEYRAAAQKRGVKLDLEQWLPRPPSDEENLALTPLFRELDSKGKEAWENFLKLPADALYSEDDASSGKSADLRPSRQAMLDAKLIDTATADPAADVLRALERSVGPDMDRLAETLATRALRLPLNWEGGFLSSAWTSPYLRGSFFQVRAAKLYYLRSTVRVVRGEGALATQDLLAILRLGQTLEDQPMLLCGIVREILTAVAVPGVQRGLAAEVWTEPELRALEEAMSGVDLLSMYRRVWESERAMENDFVERLLRDSPARQQLIGRFFGTSSSPLRKRIEGYGWALVPECWFRWNQLIHNQWFDAMDARIDPAGGRMYLHRGRVEALVDYARGNEINRLRFLLFNTAVYMVSGHDSGVASVHTRSCQARIAIALERFRLANGSYPQALDQLVPSYLPKLPIDVYTGQPFYYRQTEDGRFVLADSYSAARIRNATTFEQVAAAVREGGENVWHYIPTNP